MNRNILSFHVSKDFTPNLSCSVCSNLLVGCCAGSIYFLWDESCKNLRRIFLSSSECCKSLIHQLCFIRSHAKFKYCGFHKPFTEGDANLLICQTAVDSAYVYDYSNWRRQGPSSAPMLYIPTLSTCTSGRKHSRSLTGSSTNGTLSGSREH